MPAPAVSIIMPAFNRERYLAESIESVLNQTFSDWELIVVDDGSSDSTPAIIERYRLRFPERVKPISQANSGVAAARNTGIKASTGELVALPGRGLPGRERGRVHGLSPAERVDDLSAERKGGGTSLEAEAKAEKHHQEKNGLDGMNELERTKPGIHQLSGWSVQSVESVQSVLVSSLVFRRTSAAACRPREAIRSTARSTARRRTSHRSGRADCRRRGGPARVRDRASSGFDRAPR